MKKILFLTVLTLSLLSCKTSKHADCDAYSQVNVSDSTEYNEIMKSQEALAIYIESLSEREQKEWINGTFTEEEKNAFIEKIEKN